MNVLTDSNTPKDNFLEYLDRYNVNKNLSKEELITHAVVREVGWFYGLSTDDMREAILL